MTSTERVRREEPFSLCVCIAVPPGGFAARFATMPGWLDAVCGPAGWAAAPAGLSGVFNDAIAFYFTDRAVARTFVARFACGYRTHAAETLD